MIELGKADVISMVKEACIIQPSIMGVFVLGCFSGEDTEKHSELEFFIIISDNKNLEEIRKSMVDFSENINHIIRITFWTYEDIKKPESLMVQVVFREGKLIYWNSINDMVASQVFKVKPHTIISFVLNKLEQKGKAKFNYQLYGKKNDGLLNKLGGKRITKACFYLPYSNKFRVIRFLSNNNVQYQCTECWI